MQHRDAAAAHLQQQRYGCLDDPLPLFSGRLLWNGIPFARELGFPLKYFPFRLQREKLMKMSMHHSKAPTKTGWLQPHCCPDIGALAAATLLLVSHRRKGRCS
ncbi:hypothetical protein TraAM80_01977 [Trypanosoma rangeli]|uniref:Uncharacterized protein n=1 Tax=Trypanosoma rangeli TaxID=5698 RepID=A0A422NWY2_TRYRA|nr:uncharacterized protein TraAM80_01977 [Trypanosoma rangeli]RNF09925.1 hypothetical protein TraAM80_01977 [Trypanosoma rangeli]|eukprot:RNF09925.1 hypothetical protein TraAM80_01977 [Trypanosoma rangeli]